MQHDATCRIPNQIDQVNVWSQGCTKWIDHWLARYTGEAFHLALPTLHAPRSFVGWARSPMDLERNALDSAECLETAEKVTMFVDVWFVYYCATRELASDKFLSIRAYREASIARIVQKIAEDIKEFHFLKKTLLSPAKDFSATQKAIVNARIERRAAELIAQTASALRDHYISLESLVQDQRLKEVHYNIVEAEKAQNTATLIVNAMTRFIDAQEGKCNGSHTSVVFSLDKGRMVG